MDSSQLFLASILVPGVAFCFIGVIVSAVLAFMPEKPEAESPAAPEHKRAA